MANGPFQSSAPPGVYTRTTAAQTQSGPPAGIQIPLLIGVGQETLLAIDQEIVRGSSSTVDQSINRENVSLRAVLDNTNIENPILGEADGATSLFRVLNTPIVVGDGQGVVSNRPQDVQATVDGVSVVVARVDGRRGVVQLQVAPPAGSRVEISYFFNRTDTQVTNDLSGQVSTKPATLRAPQPGAYVVVLGQTDVLALRVNGSDSSITLPSGTLSATDVALAINAAQVEGLTASADLDNQGQSRLQIEADGSLEILTGSANVLFGFLSGQVTSRNTTFVAYEGPIVDGSNGGLTSTNPSDITVRVNGVEVSAVSLDGANSTFVLAEAPLVNSTVEVTYFYNSFQNTFDYLPNQGIDTIASLGNAPGRTDFVQGLDYILQDDRILWGSGISLTTGRVTAGSEVFDDTQITTSLRDNRMYLESVNRVQDLSVAPPRPSETVFALGNPPTKGDGRDTLTSNPLLVDVYHGPNLPAALSAGKRRVAEVDPATRRVTLEDPMPAGDHIWASYYYNRLQDDVLTLTREASGRFRMSSQLRGEDLYNVRFVSTDSVDTVQFPGGVQSNPDAFYIGSDGVNEQVTVTFTSVGANVASFTTALPGTYDIFEGASDQLYLIMNDGGRGVTNDAVTVDLAQASFATLFGDAQEPASNYVVTTGTNDVFAFNLDGVNYSHTMPAATYTIDTLVAELNRSVATTAFVTGTLQETFDFSVGRDYDVTINGTNVAGTVTGTATDSASVVAAALIASIQTVSGTLTGGDLAVAGNDFNVVANSDGTVTLSATDTLIVSDAGGGTDVEDLLGWAVGTTTNVRVFRSWQGVDKEYVVMRSRTLVTGPSDVSRIQILSGSSNSLVGYSPFAESLGSESAVNKGATLISTDISATSVTNLEATEPDFVISIDGVEYTVIGSAFDGIASVADIVTVIDAVIGSVANVTQEGSKIRFTSLQDDNTSSIEIGGGSANSSLGLTTGALAGQRRVTASDVVSVLNAQSTAWADESDSDLATLTTSTEALNVLYARELEVVGAGSYVQFNTFNTGIDVSLTFDDGAQNALNDTGLGIEDGDTASGTAGQDGFNVASSSPNGSTGQGLVGQTYTDAITGLRFTVLDAEDGSYTIGQGFVLQTESQMLTGSTTVNKAIPGVDLIVTALTGVSAGDTALIETFDKSGAEPGVGDFYYITYNYLKEAFTPQFFTRFREVEANYGTLSPENPLSLAAYLALLNGASVVGALQVPKPLNGVQATATSFNDALEVLSRPLTGGTRPDIIVPLSTDPAVAAAVTKFCEIQSTPRFRNECRGMFGVASGTLPADAQALARGLNSSRALVVYPDSAILTLQDELGNETSFIVDGTYMASALAGVIVSPSNDVATPLTRRRLVGFNQVNRSLDEVTKNGLAVAGVTVLEDSSPFLRVRQGLTTNVSNRLTSTPSIVAIQDFVQQQARATLDRFIGLKFSQGRAQDVELALTGLLNTLVENQIITAHGGASATPDPNDPTLLNVEALYSPIFPLLFISIRFTISSSI